MTTLQLFKPETVWGDPAVVLWVGCYRGRRPRFRVYLFGDWLRWLQESEWVRANRPLLVDLDPSGLVSFQKDAQGQGEDREFYVLDALQQYIREKAGTFNALSNRYSAVRMFFKKNRASLPDDSFEIVGSKPPSREKLTLEIVKSLIHSVNPRMKPAYLSLWMGVMDQERLINWINDPNSASALTKHLKEKGSNVPFMIEYPGRKQTRNRLFYHTYLGHDALESWQEYFERIRGWPKNGEPLMLNVEGDRLTDHGIQTYHLRLLERLHYIKRGGRDSSRRYGYNLHEMRDVARTFLRLHAVKDGLDLVVVEFFMGHLTDKNLYEKLYNHPDETIQHYKIAEKYLNIISGKMGQPVNLQAEFTKLLSNPQVRQEIISSQTFQEIIKDAAAQLTPMQEAKKT